MGNARLNESQAGIKIARKNNNLRYADDTTLTAESEEELNSFLMKVKEESEKADLKLSFQKPQDHGIWYDHFMANIRGKSGSSDRLYSRAPKSLQTVTAAMKSKLLLLVRKAMTNVENVLKSQDITLLTKVCIVKAMVSLVVM